MKFLTKFLTMAFLICLLFASGAAFADPTIYSCGSLKNAAGTELLGVHYDVSIQGDQIVLRTILVSPDNYVIETPMEAGEAEHDFAAYESAHYMVYLIYGDQVQVQVVSRDVPGFSAYCLKTSE